MLLPFVQFLVVVSELGLEDVGTNPADGENANEEPEDTIIAIVITVHHLCFRAAGAQVWHCFGKFSSFEPIEPIRAIGVGFGAPVVVPAALFRRFPETLAPWVLGPGGPYC